MKKLIVIFSVILAIGFTSQSYAAIYGAKAGLNLSNMVMKDNNGTYSNDFKMIPGFHLGATAEFPIKSKYSIEAGLLFSTKGYKYESSLQGQNYNASITLNYLDIPVLAKGVFNLQGFDVYGVFGPYFGYGLNGKAKTDSDELGGDEDLSFGTSTDDDFKPLDYGLQLGAGVVINNFEVGLAYSFGLANISIYEDDNLRVNNRVISVTLGYKFNKKK